MNKSEEGDGGEYICWAENRAGKAETNFTLRIGYFGGSGQYTLYLCTQHRVGTRNNNRKAETNFTLWIGYFGGSGQYMQCMVPVTVARSRDGSSANSSTKIPLFEKKLSINLRSEWS